jgi:hypothetical protein
MQIIVTVKGEEGEEGGQDAAQFAAVLQEAANLMLRKNAEYGSAWREQGWMGNLARIMSKSARLKNMLWRRDQVGGSNDNETVQDTLIDLINISVFMKMNLDIRNQFGRTGQFLSLPPNLPSLFQNGEKP